MKVIFKYEIEARDHQSVEMPAGAQILSVQVQRDVPCIWAIVDPANPVESRSFEVFGTGHPFPACIGSGREYIGTFQLLAGSLVFHLFEVR
jgi:hypothetical protein